MLKTLISFRVKFSGKTSYFDKYSRLIPGVKLAIAAITGLTDGIDVKETRGL